MKSLAALALLSLTSASFASPFEKNNDPKLFNPVMNAPVTTDFASLPLEGKLRDSTLAWSETYWPSNVGGIAYRWNSKNPLPFKYKLLTRAEVMSATEVQLSELSPAELYDIAMGDYNYTLTKKVLSVNKPTDLWWEGICHGWSQAASNYSEPAPVIVTNKDGVKVPFGSSDVKGLLSMHDAYNSKGFFVRIGDRCDVKGKVKGEESEEDGPISPPSPEDASKPKCSDVNAGAFHVVISNMIGINSQGFVADVDRFNDVWNQPVKEYSSEVVGNVAVTDKEAKSGVKSKLHMKTKMVYGEELDYFTPELEAEGEVAFVSKEPVSNTIHEKTRFKIYEYIVELDVNGKVIGGTWLTETRPDMLWTKKKDPQFRDGKFPLSGLNKIYKPVAH
ncbi:MAG: hypothetical protein ACJ76H_04990 [Bacteriovoracaceae bacterium]